MTIDFPNSPTLNDTFTVGNRTWQWNGTAWELETTSSIVPISEDPIALILALGD
jgi:hypothetical protein